MTDRVGQQFGKYRLIRLLGRGGFAEVYLGERTDINFYAAIKIGTSQLNSNETAAFRAEAQTLAQLVHPRIIRLLDFDVEHGIPFLIMDYAPNGSLRQQHPSGSVVPLDKVVAYVQAIAEGLYYAHQRNIVHRDVKPENVLLGKNRELLLSDFGIARIGSNSTTFNISGTLYYMSPEQFNGKIYPASDQYALGAITYEWLTGAMLYGHVTDMGALINQIINQTPVPLRQKAPNIPFAVEQAVMKALSKDPSRRFTTIMEYAHALEQGASTKQSYPAQPMPSSTPPPPQPSPRPSPVNRGAVSSVPALPLVDTKQIIWPTFALTPAQRQEIARGQLPVVPLRTTSSLSNTMPRPLPVGQVVTPPTTHNLDKLINTGQIIVRRTAPHAAVNPVQPVAAQGTGANAAVKGGVPPIARTTTFNNAAGNGLPPAQAAQNPVKSPVSSSGVVRSTSNVSPSQKPSPPTARPVAPQKLTAGNVWAWLFIATGGTLSLVDIGILSSSSGSQSAFGTTSTFAYIALLLAFLIGVADIAPNKAKGNMYARNADIWCVVLAVLLTLVEIGIDLASGGHNWYYSLNGLLNLVH